MTTLKQHFEIRSGYTFRGALADLPAGDVRVIQSRDLASASLDKLPGIAMDAENHRLRGGDVLVGARGNFFARVILGDDPVLVASSSVFVLRPLDQAIRPEFLASYLNSAIGQAALRSISSGATIKTLTKPQLEALAIPNVPISEQQVVVSLDAIVDEYLILTAHRQRLMTSLRDGVIEQMIKGDKL